MARKTNSDSHLDLEVSARTERLSAPGRSDESLQTKILLLGIESQEPLPPLSDRTAEPGGTIHQQAGSATRGTGPVSPSGLWLNGDVVMCACPDCGAPMTVRLWLMVADCWRCGASIELSEQQERESRRLLQQQQRSLQHDPPATATSRQPAVTVPKRPARPPVGNVPAKPAQPARRPPRSDRRPPTAPPRPAARRVLADSRWSKRDRDLVGWLHAFLQDMPAWLVSLVFHIILLTFLGLLTQAEEDGPYIRLSAKIARDVRDGGDTRIVSPTDDSEFDLGLPDTVDLQDPDQRRAMVRADQQARELRLIDPDNPHLPDLEAVKRSLGNVVAPSQLLVARDPRLRVEMVRRAGGTTFTEAAVARGLLWLKRHQNPNGSWSLDRFRQAGSCRCGGRGSLSSDHAGTSLALLPFLGAGQTHLTGIYKDEVSRGLRWLVQHQKSNGDLRGSSAQYPGMYAHGQAAIVLCEAFLMTGDEALRVPAQRAIDFIVAAQYLDGGWRYYPNRPGMQVRGDTSVLGWQLMALQSARAANLVVPEVTIENASHFLDGVQHHEGARYGYIRHDRPSPPMTAEGLLCRIYLGWQRSHPALRDGIDWMVNEQLPTRRAPDIYYWYYATQAIHHFGGAQWERWNLRMRDILVDAQETRGHAAGSWSPNGPLTQKGGRIYMTSLAICCLEVYYRHLPLFQQLDLGDGS